VTLRGKAVTAGQAHWHTACFPEQWRYRRVPAVLSERSGPGSTQLEGAACASATVGGPPAPSAPAREANEDRPLPSGRTVYALEQAGRNNVYCSSAACCVSALLAEGWRQSNARQLTALVKELATGRATATHDPSDHFS
jgi:hypothetical protein